MKNNPTLTPIFSEVQRAFARHLRDPAHAPAPDDVEPRRMKIYRELFFNNLSSLLAGTFPVLHEILGPEHWAALIRDFMVRHEAHTPLFTEVPQELLRFVQETRWAEGVPHPDDPPFLLELAHYEWVELALQISTETHEAAGVDRDGDLLTGVPVVSPLAWPLAYAYPVHTLSVDHQPTEAPAVPTFLVVYRRRDDQVKFMVVSAATARLLDLASAENSTLTGQEIVNRVGLELGGVGVEFLAGAGAEALSMLRAHDVLLGIRR